MTTDEQWEGGVLDGGGRLLDQIRLTGITATGYHGVFEFERREGQTFVADVVVHLDTRRAAARDDLAHTLHYGELAEQVSAVLSGEPVDLIETVAERIAATVLVARDRAGRRRQRAQAAGAHRGAVRGRRRAHPPRPRQAARRRAVPAASRRTSAPVRPAPTPTAAFPVTPAPGARSSPGSPRRARAPVVPVAAASSRRSCRGRRSCRPRCRLPPAPGALSSGPDGPVAAVVPTRSRRRV